MYTHNRTYGEEFGAVHESLDMRDAGDGGGGVSAGMDPRKAEWSREDESRSELDCLAYLQPIS